MLVLVGDMRTARTDRLHRQVWLDVSSSMMRVLFPVEAEADLGYFWRWASRKEVGYGISQTLGSLSALCLEKEAKQFIIDFAAPCHKLLSASCLRQYSASPAGRPCICAVQAKHAQTKADGMSPKLPRADLFVLYRPDT